VILQLQHAFETAQFQRFFVIRWNGISTCSFICQIPC